MKTYIVNLSIVVLMIFLNTSCNCVQKTFPKFAKKIIPVKTISIATTAYHAKEKDHIKYGNKAASGETLKISESIAADWSVLPVGTKLKICGHVYTVSDYGSALVNHTRKGLPIVDIYQPSKIAMNKWGVKFFDDVEIVEWGSYEKSLSILRERLKYSHCRYMYNQIQNKI